MMVALAMPPPSPIICRPIALNTSKKLRCSKAGQDSSQIVT
jgi:hypothetical protein